MDVKDNKVVKGVKFESQNCQRYIDLVESSKLKGADELVFYDICASADGTTIDYEMDFSVCKEKFLFILPFEGNKFDRIGSSRPSIQAQTRFPLLLYSQQATTDSELVTEFGSQSIVVKTLANGKITTTTYTVIRR